MARALLILYCSAYANLASFPNPMDSPRLYSFPFQLVDKMTIFDEIKNVQRLAEAEAAGDPNAHSQLLAAIRKLQLAAEKPIDTTSRVNFQVSPRT
jgi:hypothetical protein